MLIHIKCGMENKLTIFYNGKDITEYCIKIEYEL